MRARAVWIACAALAFGVLGAVPSVADAGIKGFHNGIKGFSAGSEAPKGSATQPAVAPAPGKSSGEEWFVVTNSHKATVLAISKSGKISKVSGAIAAGVGTIPGNAGAQPSYGATIMDGYEWLVKYGQNTSPLYAINGSGKVHEVSRNVGDDITDLTAGPDDTLNFTSQKSGIITCSITGDPSADCSDFSLAGLLNWIAGFGQLDAIASDSGKLWFTDDDGELGAFNLVQELLGGVGTILSDLFEGPFGDVGSGSSAVGEASNDPNTITADRNGYLYVAGGKFTSKSLKNDEILKVNPKTGKRVAKYTRGLTDVTSLTAGPGNNVWFLDRKSAHSGKVGVLNVRSGKITEYALPAGFKFGPYISRISVGPSGSKTLYFTLETKSGGAAIGEVTGA